MASLFRELLNYRKFHAYNDLNFQKLAKLDQNFVDPGHEITTVKEARAEIAENFKYITENFHKYPYYEYVRFLERNFLLLSAIGRLEPCLF